MATSCAKLAITTVVENLNSKETILNAIPLLLEAVLVLQPGLAGCQKMEIEMVSYGVVIVHVHQGHTAQVKKFSASSLNHAGPFPLAANSQ